MSQQTSFKEEFEVSANQVVDKVKELLHEGNVHRILIRQNGRTILELPVTFAAIGVIIAPLLAAAGSIAALATNCTIVVERVNDPNQQQ